MLTENELKWLADRAKDAKEGVGYYCKYKDILCAAPDYCPVEPDLADFEIAAEFEARVAAKLADMEWCVMHELTEITDYRRITFLDGADCVGATGDECDDRYYSMALPHERLYRARIAVEQEMANRR